MNFEPILENQELLNFFHSPTQSYIHSRFDPLKEGSRFVSYYSPNADVTPCWIGLGALHHIDFVLRLHGDKVKRWIFWEPFSEIATNPQFLKKWERIADEMTRKGIDFVLLPPDPLSEEWQTAWNQFLSRSEGANLSIEFFPFPYYSRFAAKEVTEFKSNLSRQKNLHEEINESTQSFFQKIWTQNYLKNLSCIEKRDTIFWLDDFSLEGKSVLFVGASPALEEIISEISKIRQNVILLASDTCLGFLLHHSILPDAVLSMDPGRGTLFHFLPEIPKSVKIITWLGGNPHLFSLPNPIYLVNTNHPFDQLVGHYWNSEAVLPHRSKQTTEVWKEFENPSLNLIGMAIAFAERGKADKLILAGVSFKEESGKSHCKGTGYESYRLPQTTRKTTYEMLNRRLYGKERSGKNLLAWDSIWNRKKNISILPFSEYILEKSNINGIENENESNWMASFRGNPQVKQSLWERAFQEFPHAVSLSTLKRWNLV